MPQDTNIRPRLFDEFKPASYDEWRTAVDKLLKGKPYEKIMLTKTDEGFVLDPIYRKEDLPKDSNGLPGVAPYLRGTKTLGYLEDHWKIAQEIATGDVKEFNEKLLEDLMKGQTAVNICLDDATLQAINATNANKDEVGCCGLSINSLADLETALNKVELNYIDIYIHAFSSSLPIAAMLFSIAKKQNAQLKGAVGCDPLSQLSCQGKIGLSLEKAYNEMFELTKYASQNHPNLKTIAIHSYPWQYSGGDAATELAYSMATAVDYIDAMLARGLDINTIAKHMHFSFAVGANFFMEIAKFRAARVIFANIIKEYGGNEEAQKICIHGRTSKHNKTKFDPYVNMLRTTTEAFSAVMGGVDSLHVGAFDEVVRMPNDFSRRIARNTQIMLSEECHFNHVVDPAGGSWFVENLTKMLGEQAWEKFANTVENGGLFANLKNEAIQNDIENIFGKKQQKINTRRKQIVGTNIYANIGEELLEPNCKCGFYEARIKQVEENKSNFVIDASNLVESMIAGFEDGLTLEEATKQVREGAEQVKPVVIRRASQAFEELRTKVENYTKQNERPKVFLANFGGVAKYKGRADFSRGFFEVAGFDIIDEGCFETYDEAVKAIKNSNAKIFVICSVDADYPEIVPNLLEKVKGLGLTSVLAGYPKDQIEAHKQAGINEFIHVKANAFEILSNMLEKVGVK